MPKRRGYTVRRLRVKGRNNITHKQRGTLHRVGGRLGHYKSKIGRVLGAGKFHPFPPMLSSVLRTTWQTNLNTTLAGSKNNAADIIIPANVATNVGPFVNYPLGTLSSEATNVPAGIYYLLGAEKFDGSAPAPYNKYFVSSSTLSVTVCAYNDTGVSPNKPIQVVILPLSDNAATIAETMSTNNLMEQEHVKRWLLPPSQTVVPHRYKTSLSSKEAFGLQKLTNDDYLFVGTNSTEPTNQWSWIIRFSNAVAADTAAYNIVVECELTQHITFFDRNMMTSSQVGVAGGATGAQGVYNIHPSTGATGSNVANSSGDYNPSFGSPTDSTYVSL